MLEIEGLSAWYGEARVLQNISLSVHAGEVVTLVGRNGAGKTTLLRSVMGLHRQIEGSVRFDGSALGRRSPDSRARAGLGWVPDDRGIYGSPGMSVGHAGARSWGSWSSIGPQVSMTRASAAWAEWNP